MNATCYKCRQPAIRYPCNKKAGVLCRKCRSEYSARRYSVNRCKIIERADEWNRVNSDRRNKGEHARYLRNKIASVAAYGGRCGSCGEDEVAFLVIDHINDDGADDRREWKSKASDIHKWLKRNSYPDGYQILCGNCNLKKERVRRRKQESKTKNSEYARKTREAARLEVLERYGPTCRCCGEIDADKLVIDHVNGGGSHEKQRYPARNIYLYLVCRQVDHSRYQVLCQNCNQAKASFGICPHCARQPSAISPEP